MKISTANLKAALAPVLPIAGNRCHSLPILSMLRLESKGRELEIQASNLDVHAISKVECEGELPPICVSASAIKYLADSANGEVLIIPQAGSVGIKSGWASKLPTTDPSAKESAFPPFPIAKTKPIGVNAADLSAAIAGVSWAASSDDQRYVLKTVAVFLSAKEIRCVSTDGKHLCECRKPSIAAESEFLIPEAYADYVAASLAEDSAQLAVGENYLTVTHKKGSVAVRLVEGTYPNYKSIVNEPTRELGSLGTEELIKHIETASRICISDFCYGHIRFGKKSADIDFKDSKGLGDYWGSILGKFSEQTIRVDAARMLSVLKPVKSDTITIECTQANAIKFKDGDFTFVLQVLTPLPESSEP